MEVPYEKQTLDHPNPIARFAHRARFRVSRRIVLSLMQDGSTLLDYGCGQGRFLGELSSAIERTHTLKVTLFGYEPYMSARFTGYKAVRDLEAVPDSSVDVITGLEVCEHLDDAELKDFIEFCRRSLSSKGWLLITVPIMFGPVVLIKELSRCILFRRWSDTSLSELLAAALFGIPPRRAENIKASHRGYDWRETLEKLKVDFDLHKLEFSPFSFLGWYGNSQAIMLFKQRP